MIRISDQNWERLKQLAVPLEDTPDDVVGRLLDSYGCSNNSVEAGGKAGKWQRDPKATHSISQGTRRLERGLMVSQGDFRIPILQALYEMGGRARGRQVLDAVEQKMQDQLRAVDYETLKSGEIRWRKAANWARNQLVHVDDYLRDDSERGVWELSNAGTRFIEAALKAR